MSTVGNITTPGGITPWHAVGPAQALRLLGNNTRSGLAAGDAVGRLERYAHYQPRAAGKAVSGPVSQHSFVCLAGLERLLALAVYVLTLLLTGCMVGPNYRRPALNAPSVFRGATGAVQQASFADIPWWQIFQDDRLNELIRTSLANNYDLAAAVDRVERARQVAAEARSQYLPAINYSTIISYGHNQFVNSPASNLLGAQGFLLGIARASWEADLWGRIRRTNEAARAQYLGTEEARRGVMLTLASDVSQAYFELLGLRYKLEIARATAQSYIATLRLFTERWQGGLGNQLQTSRAAADLGVANASIPEIERLIALKENQINLLLGRNPGPVETRMKLIEETLPLDVPAGLPSALLERRPDVLAAAANVRAANAQIGVTKAAYFPAIGLTTFFGKLSTPLADLSSGNTNAWSVGSNIFGPIFQGGALKGPEPASRCELGGSQG